MADGSGSVRVSFPPFFEVADVPPRRARRVVESAALPSENDVVFDGLRRSELTVVREVSATPVAERELAKRGPSEATVEVDLGPNEDAVLLVEQDGVYTWQTDYREQHVRKEAAHARTVVFTIDIEPERATRSLKSFFVRPLHTIIVKFARLVAGAVAAHLENGIHRGLVKIGGSKFADWADLDSLKSLGLHQKDAPRILLFLHGTNSSTRGSFGALTDSSWGKAFLDAARTQYDALIGFDHATLRDDPLQNATELLSALRAVAWKTPPRIDVLNFSRGGLVYRALVELLLPGGTFQPKFERSIFVAVPNAGTHLADPKNWKDFVDLYTNLSAAVFRLLSLMPQTQTASFILSEAIAITGSLVKSLTDPKIVGDKVPGLAAMSPNEPFLAKLNEVSDTGPSIASTHYCYITSDFEAGAGGAPPKEIPPGFWMRLADGFVDRLLESETSDLVIDTKSVPQVDPKAGTFMKQWYEFPANSYVYHTNYFTRPEVVDSLMKWLLGRGGTQLAPGSIVAPAIPAGFDGDVLLAAAEDSAPSLRERVEEEAPSYVVVRRWWNDERYHYAFPAEDVLTRLNGIDAATSVREGLDLHEGGRSQAAKSIEHVVPSRTTESSEREILYVDGEPVAVKSEMLESAADVTTLESAVANPKNAGERILRRRAMPPAPSPSPAPAPPHAPAPRRRAMRGGRLRSAAPSPTPPPSDSTYHFLGQMDGTVVHNLITRLEVTISPDAIAPRAGAASSSGVASLAPEQTLTLEVFPRRNFAVIGDTRKEIDVASLTSAKTFEFQVYGTDLGSGEIWITASQGQSPLLTLVLQATIVETLARPPAPATANATATAAPTPVPAFHKLTIREAERGGQTYLNFELQAPELNLFDQWESEKPLPAARESYVRTLYDEIEQMWAQNSEQASQFIDELRAFGMTLFDQLIPLRLQQVLWENRDRLRSIMVVSTEPFLPWEVLFLHEPGQGVTPEGRFFGQMGLVRWLYGNWPPMKLRIRKEKTLVVAPNYPAPDELPSAQEEVDYLVQKFGATRVQATYSDVKSVLSTAGRFDLLHFACHGANDADKIDTRLLLENGGELKSMVVSSLAQFGADHRPMIVLNACQVGSQKQGLTTFGGFAKAFLARQAGVFVAPLWSVGDKEATLFSRQLYDSIQNGDTISEATIAARETTRQLGEDATWLAYAVYGHPHARCEVEK
jgi:hypothetical protein